MNPEKYAGRPRFLEKNHFDYIGFLVFRCIQDLRDPDKHQIPYFEIKAYAIDKGMPDVDGFIDLVRRAEDSLNEAQKELEDAK